MVLETPIEEPLAGKITRIELSISNTWSEKKNEWKDSHLHVVNPMPYIASPIHNHHFCRGDWHYPQMIDFISGVANITCEIIAYILMLNANSALF